MYCSHAPAATAGSLDDRWGRSKKLAPTAPTVELGPACEFADDAHDDSHRRRMRGDDRDEHGGRALRPYGASIPADHLCDKQLSGSQVACIRGPRRRFR